MPAYPDYVYQTLARGRDELCSRFNNEKMRRLLAEVI